MLQRNNAMKNKLLAPVLFCLCYLHTVNGFRSRGKNMEQTLKQHLFPPEFDSSVRPVENYHNNVTVSVDISLNYLVNMNERIQTLQTEIWIRLKWIDFQLSWHPSKFGNITAVHVPVDKIWTPDIVIFNDVGLETGKDPRDFLVQIDNDGMVQWLYPRTVETSCKLNVYYFPFDTQLCKFVFGSWAFPGNFVDVQNYSERGETDKYVDNGEWRLVDITAERQLTVYHCCAEPYSDVTFTLVLQRRSLYYVFNIIMPCILITTLHLTTFLLPAESGEKISLNVTLLLGLTVFLLLVAEIMPPQAEVIPVIAQFFGVCIIQVTLSTIASVLILHLHFRGSRGFPLPPCVRSILLGKLGRLLCYGGLLQQTSKRQYQKRNKKHKDRENGTAKNNGKVELLSVKVSPMMNGHCSKGESHETECRARSSVYRHDSYVLNSEGKPAMEDLGVLHRRTEDKEEDEKAIIQDWILVSLILDRLFFVLFGLMQLASILFVMRYMVLKTVHTLG